MQRSEITGGFVERGHPVHRPRPPKRQAFLRQSLARRRPRPFWPPVEKWGDGSKRGLYLSVLRGNGPAARHSSSTTSATRPRCATTRSSSSAPTTAPSRRGQRRPLPRHQDHALRRRHPLAAHRLGAGPDRQRTRPAPTTKPPCSPPSISRPRCSPSPESPAAADATFDGENLAPVLLGKAPLAQRSDVLASSARPQDRLLAPARCPTSPCASGDWKLLCEYDGSNPNSTTSPPTAAKPPTSPRNIPSSSPASPVPCSPGISPCRPTTAPPSPLNCSKRQTKRDKPETRSFRSCVAARCALVMSNSSASNVRASGCSLHFSPLFATAKPEFSREVSMQARKAKPRPSGRGNRATECHRTREDSETL